jgi:hypothetical protein
MSALRRVYGSAIHRGRNGRGATIRLRKGRGSSFCALQAARRADELDQARDPEGCATWCRIWDAIVALPTKTPAEGQVVERSALTLAECLCRTTHRSIRRECLNHVIVQSEHHLRRLLSSYLRYYHHSRTHLSLQKDFPEPRLVQPPDQGKIIPQVGGLHYRYERRAA